MTARSPKSQFALIVLFLLLGGFGMHRFYAGRTQTAILQMSISAAAIIFLVSSIIGRDQSVLTASTLLFVVNGVWMIVDFFTVVTGRFRDSDDLPINAS